MTTAYIAINVQDVDPIAFISLSTQVFSFIAYHTMACVISLPEIQLIDSVIECPKSWRMIYLIIFGILITGIKICLSDVFENILNDDKWSPSYKYKLFKTMGMWAFGYCNNAMIGVVSKKMQVSIDNVRTDLHTEINNLRTDTTTEFANVHTEFANVHTEINDLRTEMRAGFANIERILYELNPTYVMSVPSDQEAHQDANAALQPTDDHDSLEIIINCDTGIDTHRPDTGMRHRHH